MILNGKHKIGPEEAFLSNLFPLFFQNLIFAVEFKLVEMVIFKAKTGKWNEMRIKCVQVMIRVMSNSDHNLDAL